MSSRMNTKKRQHDSQLDCMEYNEQENEPIDKKIKHVSSTYQDRNRPTLVDMPVEIIARVYNQLSSSDNCALFNTNSYFQYTQAITLKKFKHSRKLKDDPNVWLARFTHLEHLIIKQSRNNLPSIDASLLSRRLLSLKLPDIKHLIIQNPHQLPHTLIKLDLPGSTVYFDDAHYLPRHLESLTLEGMELDANGHFPLLPSTLTYLYVACMKHVGKNWREFNRLYVGLPDSLRHLHAPFSTNVTTIQALPRKLISLCNVGSSDVEDQELAWLNHHSDMLKALPPDLEHLRFGVEFGMMSSHLCFLPTSLRTLDLSCIRFVDTNHDGFNLNHLARFTQLNELCMCDDITLKDIPFPTTLTKLKMNRCVALEQIIDDAISSLPPSLIDLHLGAGYSLNSSSLRQLPLNLNRLELMCDVSPVLMMNDIAHLHQLSHLHIATQFDYCSLEYLPRTLTSLEFFDPQHSYYVDDDRKNTILPYMTCNVWSKLPNLKRFIFHGMSNWVRKAAVDPELLKTLPRTLTELDLNRLPIHADAWKYLPDTLKILGVHIRLEACETFFDHLPRLLHTLKVYSCCDAVLWIAEADLPPNLVKIQGLPLCNSLNPTQLARLPFWSHCRHNHELTSNISVFQSSTLSTHPESLCIP